jgi:hypothetical protein
VKTFAERLVLSGKSLGSLQVPLEISASFATCIYRICHDQSGYNLDVLPLLQHLLRSDNASLVVLALESLTLLVANGQISFSKARKLIKQFVSRTMETLVRSYQHTAADKVFPIEICLVAQLDLLCRVKASDLDAVEYRALIVEVIKVSGVYRRIKAWLFVHTWYRSWMTCSPNWFAAGFTNLCIGC